MPQQPIELHYGADEGILLTLTRKAGYADSMVSAGLTFSIGTSYGTPAIASYSRAQGIQILSESESEIRCIVHVQGSEIAAALPEGRRGLVAELAIAYVDSPSAQIEQFKIDLLPSYQS